MLPDTWFTGCLLDATDVLDVVVVLELLFVDGVEIAEAAAVAGAGVAAVVVAAALVLAVVLYVTSCEGTADSAADAAVHGGNVFVLIFVVSDDWQLC